MHWLTPDASRNNVYTGFGAPTLKETDMVFSRFCKNYVSSQGYFTNVVIYGDSFQTDIYVVPKDNEDTHDYR